MRHLLCFFFAFIATGLFGNGGPIDGSAVYKTGDIVLINQPMVDLVKEDLKIVLEGDYSIVTVVYELFNNSSYTDQEITYGFPIEFLRTELNYDLEWQDEYLPEIQFSLDGQNLNIKHQVDLATEEVKGRLIDGMPGDMRRSWHVVDFTLSKLKTARLEVRYKVKNGYQDWATSKDFFPVFDKRHLYYDFQPAKKWGDGTVSALKVEIDTRNIGGQVDISGLSLTNEAGVYTGSFSNFDLKNAKDLDINYSDSDQKLSNFIREHWFPQSYIKSVTATSQLEGDYQAKNLIDRDPKTAWVEGKEGLGIGEKIVIELSESRSLSGIALINGYTKNEGTYTTNGRVKKVRVDRVMTPQNDPDNIIEKSEEFDLEDLDYMEITDGNLSRSISVIGNFGRGFFKLKKLTITILEVYEGTKYADTCISEVLLMGYW